MQSHNYGRKSKCCSLPSTVSARQVQPPWLTGGRVLPGLGAVCSREACTASEPRGETSSEVLLRLVRGPRGRCTNGHFQMPRCLCFCSQEASPVACPLLSGGRPLPIVDVKPPEGPSSKSRDHPPREEEKEKKKKKHKKRSRTRSRSPKYHSSSKSRSRSHSKAKHSLPSAYRTARRSRWVCECLCGGVRPEAQVRASGGQGGGWALLVGVHAGGNHRCFTWMLLSSFSL